MRGAEGTKAVDGFVLTAFGASRSTTARRHDGTKGIDHNDRLLT